MEDTAGGNVRVRSWPTHRKLKRTKEEQNLEYAFREAMRTAKQWPPDQQADYRKAVEGTALLPTDLIMMTIYGNAFAIRMDDGRTLYSMISRAKVSESLDVLSQSVGSILARGPTFWGEVEPGTEGQVLIMGPAGVPIWADVSPGYVAAAANVPAYENNANAAYGDLATVGPTVTIITGTTAIVSLSAVTTKNAAPAGFNSYMGFAISGATTLAAADARAATVSAYLAGFNLTLSRVLLVTGLTPGANTFTAKYRENGAAFTTGDRSIAVWAI